MSVAASRVYNESDFYAQILDTHSILQHVNTSREMMKDINGIAGCSRERDRRKVFAGLMEREKAIQRCDFRREKRF